MVEDTRINPWREGVQIGISFVVGGLILTLPILFALPQARWWAYGLTTLIALALGAVKARYTRHGPVRAGLEFLAVVTLGTLAGVGLGLLLHGMSRGSPSFSPKRDVLVRAVMLGTVRASSRMPTRECAWCDSRVSSALGAALRALTP